MPRKKSTPTPEPSKGWIPKQRTRRIALESDGWEPADGAEPLWVEVAAGLTFDEVDAIPWSNAATNQDIFDAIAPYVTGWNVCGRNLATGDWDRLPPPVDAGPDVFRAIPKALIAQIVLELKFGPLPVGDQKKESTATGAMAGG